LKALSLSKGWITKAIELAEQNLDNVGLLFADEYSNRPPRTEQRVAIARA
jgi:hypothetical protein